MPFFCSNPYWNLYTSNPHTSKPNLNIVCLYSGNSQNTATTIKNTTHKMFIMNNCASRTCATLYTQYNHHPAVALITRVHLRWCNFWRFRVTWFVCDYFENAHTHRRNKQVPYLMRFYYNVWNCVFERGQRILRIELFSVNIVWIRETLGVRGII